jgi:hypothetical protein
MRECVSRIERDRSLIKLARKLVRPAAVLVEELASPQVVLIRVDVGRRHLLDRFLLVLGEHDTQCRDDAGCDLVLNRENILELAIVTLGPQLRAVIGADELRIESKSLARFPNAAFENRRNLKLATDLADVVNCPLESPSW